MIRTKFAEHYFLIKWESWIVNFKVSINTGFRSRITVQKISCFMLKNIILIRK